LSHVVRHLVLASLVALVAAGFVAPVVASAATVSVRITDHLSQAELTVPAGATIRFVNADNERHRMRSQSGPAEFDSHNLEPGQSYSMRLTARGTYTYLDERDDDDTRYRGRIVVGGATSGGGSSKGPAPALSPSVSMAGRAFSPGTVTIAAGDSVTFRNDDDRAHTVTANDGAFNSGTIGEGGSWKRTFKQAGTFSYLCAIHPEMTGKVVVKGTSSAATPKPKPSPTPKPVSKPTATGVDAEIRDFAFAPPSISVPLGSTVTWRNTGAAPHTVTAEDGSFNSEMIAAGGAWARTFETAGTFTYVCAFHPQMEGVVEVTDGDVTAVPPAVPATPDPLALPSASPAPVAVAPAATQPPPPSEPASDTAAVSTQGPSFGGELLARVAIVGLLIGGAFLLFVRAVGGSVRRRPDEEGTR
jgi:plastocyanin